MSRELPPRCRAPSHLAAPLGEPRAAASGKPHHRDRQQLLHSGVSRASSTWTSSAYGRSAAAAGRFRSPELYGLGHLLQNRTRGYIHVQRLHGSSGAEGTPNGQGANC